MRCKKTKKKNKIKSVMVCVMCLESLPERFLRTQYIVLYLCILYGNGENNRLNFNPLRVYHKDREKIL